MSIGPAAVGSPVGVPASGAPASPARRVLAQAALEARIMLRNGEQLGLALVLPIIVLVGLTKVRVFDLGPYPRIDVVAPGIMALAVMSTAFTGQAIQTGFDRRAGVLRLLATTPLGRGGLLAGKILAVLAVELVQVVVLGAVSVAMGWRPDLAGIAPAVLAAVLGTGAFVSLGLLLAGVLRAEAVLAAANLVWLLLLAGGGLLIPAGAMPDAMGVLARVLPSGSLGEAMRAALLHGQLALVPLLVLAGWLVAAALGVGRWFRWD